MRINDLEKKLKKLIEEDINDPDVYNMIFELSKYYLKQNKVLSQNIPLEEVAHLMAEDLYMKILRGGEIRAWLGYMNFAYKQAVGTWQKMFGREFIDARDDYDLENAIVSMSVAGGYDVTPFQHLYDNSYIEGLTVQIDKLMEASRCVEGTAEFMNVRLSLILSMSHGMFVSYHLDDAQRQYTSALLNVLQIMIRDDLKDVGDEKIMTHLSLLQLISLEGIDEH